MENYTQEELQQMLEKAQKNVQAMLDKMTPQERAQAELNAKKRIDEDAADMQRIIDEAARIAADPSAKAAPKFCGSCGAPAEGGRFCAYCGMPL